MAPIPSPAKAPEPARPDEAALEVAPAPARASGLPAWLWVSTTYFAEGLPYMLVRALTGVYFTDIGLKESVIGYLNFLGVPWNLKFVWAPLVDWAGTKRRWMLALQGLLVGGFAALTLFVWLGPSIAPAGTRRTLDDLARTFDPHTGLSERTILVVVVALLVGLAFLSATHDVSIDAYYIEGLPSRADQAKYTGLRVNAWRAAYLAKSALVLFAWWLNFGLGALALGAVFVVHLVGAPRFSSDATKVDRERPRLWPHLKSTLASYLAQERVWVVLLFIPLYKVGDALLFGINTTFLMRELNVTKAQLAWLSLLATGAGIVGVMVGAWWIKRQGLKRAIWPLTLAMNVTIWAYFYLALARPDARTFHGVSLIAAIHVYEYVANALGDAALTIFLIYTCKPAFKAAHFAVGTAIASVGSTVFGGLSGAFVEHHGYATLYVVAFLASIPAMLLLFFLPISDEAGK